MEYRDFVEQVKEQIQDFLPFFGNNREKAEIFSFAKKFMQPAFLSDTDMPERNIFS